MQLRQSPSMMLHLQNSKGPQSSHWGTPPRKNPAPQSPTWGGGPRGQPALVVGGGRGKLITLPPPRKALCPVGPELEVRTWGPACLRFKLMSTIAVWPWAN